ALRSDPHMSPPQPPRRPPSPPFTVGTSSRSALPCVLCARPPRIPTRHGYRAAGGGADHRDSHPVLRLGEPGDRAHARMDPGPSHLGLTFPTDPTDSHRLPGENS